MKKSYEKILRELLSIPTAPFEEQLVIDYVKSWAEKVGVKFSLDKYSNIVLELSQGRCGKPSAKKPGYVFHAHLDHPGFIAQSQRGKTVTADFRGGVQLEYFKDSRMKFFTPDGEIKATVISAKKPAKNSDQQFMTCRIKLDEKVKIQPGTIGMWDFPGIKINRDKISARACDDLAGCAAIMCCFEDIIRDKTPIRLRAVFTRAEEVGFIGAIAACKAKTIPQNMHLVGIETSRNMPGARLGDGVVIRVGDKMQSYDSELTSVIHKTAVELTKSDKKFKFCRQLMIGGSTETTAFLAHNYKAAALCLALGNYHNMSTKNKVGPEQISAFDFECLVKLLKGIATSKLSTEDCKKNVQKLCADLFKKRSSYL